MSMEKEGNVYTCLDTRKQESEKWREMKMKVEKEFRHIRRVMCTSIVTVT